MSEKRNSFLRLLKKKGFKEERLTKVEVYAINKFTTLESNKSLCGIRRSPVMPKRGSALPVIAWFE